MKKENFLIRFIKSIFETDTPKETLYTPIDSKIADNRVRGYFEVFRRNADRENGVSSEVLYLNATTLEDYSEFMLDEDDGFKYVLLLEDYTSYDDRDGGCSVNAMVECELDETMHFVGFPNKVYYNIDGTFSHKVPVDVVKDGQTYFDIPHLKERLDNVILELRGKKE